MNPLSDIPGFTYSRADAAGLTSTALTSNGQIVAFKPRSNLIPNGDLVGTPGALGTAATGWVTLGSQTTCYQLFPSTYVNGRNVQYMAYRRIIGGSGYEGFQTPATVTLTATTYTVSLWVRVVPGVTPTDIGVGWGANAANWTIATAAQLKALVPGTWNRLSMQITGTAATSYIGIFSLVPEGVGTGWDVAMVQIELGSVATNYIPTTSTAVTVADPRITNKGLLVEEARTNLALQSQNLLTTWTNTSVTLTANMALAPDNTLSAYRIVSTANNDFHRIVQNPTIAANNVFTHSVFAKPAGNQWIQVFVYDGLAPANRWANFDLINGSIGFTSGNIVNAAIVSAGNGWWRCAVTANSSPGGNIQTYLLANNINGVTAYVGDTVSAAYLWGPQFEVGSVATSYIPTGSSAVTRAVESANVAGPLPKSAVIEFTVPALSQFSGSGVNQIVADWNDGTGFNRATLYWNAADSMYLFTLVNNVVTGGLNIGAIKDGTKNRIAVNFQNGNMAVSMNGAAVTANTTASMPVTNVMNIGNGRGASYLNGYISKFVTFPSYANNTQLQALST
jgi:hypothetical protein